MGWQPTLRVPLRGIKELRGNLEFAIDINLVWLQWATQTM